MTHCPSATRATFNIPADSQFEAEAIIAKLTGKDRLTVPDYWTTLADPVGFDTADPEQRAQMKNFDACDCAENVGGMHYTEEKCEI